MPKRMLSIFLAVCFTALFSTAVAQTGEPTVTEVSTIIGENAVIYPQLEGIADAAIQSRINDDIIFSADITSHIVTLATIGDSSWGIHVQYESYLKNNIFSTVISARGKMQNGLEGQQYTALSYNLMTGGRLTLSDLFTDVDGAVRQMEKIAETSITDELSSHLEHTDITPLPTDSFTVDDDGVTFYYPSEQLSLLSGYSGACQFYYTELADYLRTDEQGVPAMIEALPKTLSASEAKAQIEAAVQACELPHVPVALGQSMTEVVDTYRLVRTPDEFPGGRYFLLEAPIMRQVLVISDAMQSGYDHSVVEGIQVRRGSLNGLEIGKSVTTDWLGILGEPDETMVFTENMAYDYNLPVGQSDIYHFGGNELRLHADANGLLYAIQLGK